MGTRVGRIGHGPVVVATDPLKRVGPRHLVDLSGSADAVTGERAADITDLVDMLATGDALGWSPLRLARELLDDGWKR